MKTFCVLDVDCKKGGDESIAALEAEHGFLPETVSSMTGGGGTHHYYRRDPTRQLKYRIAKGIELLGRGRLRSSGRPSILKQEKPIGGMRTALLGSATWSRRPNGSMNLTNWRRNPCNKFIAMALSLPTAANTATAGWRSTVSGSRLLVPALGIATKL